MSTGQSTSIYSMSIQMCENYFKKQRSVFARFSIHLSESQVRPNILRLGELSGLFVTSVLDLVLFQRYRESDLEIITERNPVLPVPVEIVVSCKRILFSLGHHKV